MADDADILAIVIPQLKRDEGCRLTAYQDTAGVYTVGYGCTGQGIGPETVWTQAQADDELAKRVDALLLQLDLDIPWWRSLDAPRAAVLVNMAFNLGVHGLLGFVRTLDSVEHGDYAAASAEMLQSHWALQVGARAQRLAKQMETGIVQ